MLKVFLTPGGWNFFGSNHSNGIVNMIVALAMMALLIKIPFWLMSAMRIGGSGRSLVGSLTRSYVMYKIGAARKNAGKSAVTALRTVNKAAAAPVAGKAGGPNARVRSTRDGQRREGVQRVLRQDQSPGRSSGPPPSSTGAPAKKPPQRTRSASDPASPDPRRDRRPSAGESPSPSARPLPRMASPKLAPPPKEATTPKSTPGGVAGGTTGKPDADPYKGIRPWRDGQYPLPLEVRRAPRQTAAPPPTPPPPAVPPRSPRPAGRQLHLPLPNLPVRRPRSKEA
jgi:hypothetical protein